MKLEHLTFLTFYYGSTTTYYYDLLTIITKSSILDVAAVLDPPLVMINNVNCKTGT